MSYLLWAVVALIGYSIFTPLVKLATNEIPSPVVALVANSILAAGALALAVYDGGDIGSYLTAPNAKYMYAAGVFLTVGILAYYRALAAGDVTVVVPVYAMFLVGSSVLSVLFLGESLTLQKGIGIALAAVGVVLTTSG